MLNKVLGIFERIYKEKGDNLLIDRFALKKGTYYLIDSKRGNIINKLDIDTGSPIDTTSGDYKIFKTLKFYSAIININKTLEAPYKKISSNQICSFCTRKSYIQKNIISKKNMEKYKNNVIKVYNSGVKKYTIEKETVEDIFYWIEDNIKDLVDYKKFDYGKLDLFFVIDKIEDTIEIFKQEYYKYLLLYLQDRKSKNESTIKEDILFYTFKRYLKIEHFNGNNYIYFTKDNIIPKEKEKAPQGALYLVKTNFNYSNFNVEIENITELKKED